jgi:hypothetical protein
VPDAAALQGSKSFLPPDTVIFVFFVVNVPVVLLSDETCRQQQERDVNQNTTEKQHVNEHKAGATMHKKVWQTRN